MNGRPRCYLAGPIAGLTYDQGQEWRSEVARRLAVYGIDAYSPLRAKEYLRALGPIDAQLNREARTPLTAPKGIVTRDRNDVRTADLVLANFLGAQRVSIGTAIEFGWADAWRVPIVAVMEPDNIHMHDMICEMAGYTVETLDEAIAICAAVLKPGGGARKEGGIYLA